MITPGLFVRVRLPIGDPHPALMVREQALQSDQSQKKVFVLREKDEKGEPYFIKDTKGKVAKDKDGNPIKAYRPEAVDVGTIGVLRDGFREITTGVKPGDRSSSVGMQKIRLGKNPATGEPNLVKARPFDPESDSTIKAAAQEPGPAHAPALSSATTAPALNSGTTAPIAWAGADRPPRRMLRPAGHARAEGRDRIVPAGDPETPPEPQASQHRVLPLLHRPADLRLGAVDRDHAGRRDRAVHAAARAVSADHAADGAGRLQLPRRQRPGRGRDRGRADRAAGQRRREHDLHVVAVHQRRLLQPDRDLQAGRRPEPGPGAGAEPGQPGPAACCPTCSSRPA